MKGDKLRSTFFGLICLVSPLNQSCQTSRSSDPKNALPISEKSSQKCGILKKDQDTVFLFPEGATGVPLISNDQESNQKLKSLLDKEVCMIADFSSPPVELVSAHLIQTKFQTLCGKISLVNDGYLYSVENDPIEYELFPSDKAAGSLTDRFGKSVCITANFKDQEVIIKSPTQIEEAKK
jgi:hypothetical protein